MSKGLEQTFVMLKPETVMHGLIGEVTARIEKMRFTILSMRMIWVTPKQAEKLYEMHKGKPFYDKLIGHILSGPVIVMIVQGASVVKGMRQIIGATDPAEAEAGTIRGDYGLTKTENVIHAADSLKNAEREIRIFFRSDEILSYKKPANRNTLSKNSKKVC
ncbi:MAG TPA: nucleoside-diphosphate kinase [archaeon]|nr:nucleoside-diphosphate kinase [archaeon]